MKIIGERHDGFFTHLRVQNADGREYESAVHPDCTSADRHEPGCSQEGEPIFFLQSCSCILSRGKGQRYYRQIIEDREQVREVFGDPNPERLKRLWATLNTKT